MDDKPLVEHIRSTLNDHGNLTRAEANALLGLYDDLCKSNNSLRVGLRRTRYRIAPAYPAGYFWHACVGCGGMAKYYALDPPPVPPCKTDCWIGKLLGTS